MIGYKIILGIVVNFVSCDKESWFSLLILLCYTEDNLHLLATDTKWEMMSEICLKITQGVKGNKTVIC